MQKIGLKRCNWARSDLMIDYHDREWGVPLHNDRDLFEFLTLEGAQAGLSWETVLRKRNHYRTAFDNFDPAAVAGYKKKRIERLLANPGVIRNRLKIEAAVQNAQSLLLVQKEFGSFDAYIWQFVGGSPKQNRWKSFPSIPNHTAESEAMSQDLRRRGFRFVGSTICYAFMQAVGMVNDHPVDCIRYNEVRTLAKKK